MPIIVNQIISPLSSCKDEIIEKAMKRCGLSENEIAFCDIHKTSLDARRRGSIHFVHSVYLELYDAKKEELLCSEYKSLRLARQPEINPVVSDQKRSGRVVITGFGPAGMFCALLLAQHGYRPLVLEKGADVDKRTEKTERFWESGELDENSNVQFGEGGAGTFSDGKLTTRIKDPNCRYVLEQFVKFGADRSILTKARPHIGTDVLRTVVKNLRKEIIRLGGEVCFETPLTEICVKNNKAVCVKSPRGEDESAALVIACGHSARSTFNMLSENSVLLEAKPFSVGVRIEHARNAVDFSLYGKAAGNPLLPVGEYQLSHRTADGRGVYTFCMCPGGVVVAASSQSGGVVTNGMSEFSRKGRNSNCAIAVSVSPKDFGEKPFDGMNFALEIEKAAYSAACNYAAPATTVGGFLSGKPSLDGASVLPTYQCGVVPYEFRKIFPGFICRSLESGLYGFSEKLSCFSDMGAVMTAPETRTSSPIRIPRGTSGTAPGIDNLYPCGEGAGYAGGIMSAAADGIRTALKIMETFSLEQN